jgi:small conductance mechanosensitive channel
VRSSAQFIVGRDECRGGRSATGAHAKITVMHRHPGRRGPRPTFAWAVLSTVSGAASAAPERVRQLGEELRETPRDLGEIAHTIVDAFFRHLPGVVTGLVLFVLFWLLSKAVVRVASRVMSRARADEEARELVLPLIRFCVLAVGVLMALDQMGFEVGSLLAGVGIAGLAVGLAAQETIANMIAGFSILWDRPFRLGDYVNVAGSQGEVTQIGLRSTRLKTLENREVILPNKEIVRQAIINHTRYPVSRIAAVATIAHGSSVERARAAILEAVRRDMPMLETPAPQVLVTGLGDLGATLEARVWVERPETPERTVFRLLEVMEAALAAAGIERARPVAGAWKSPVSAPPAA